MQNLNSESPTEYDHLIEYVVTHAELSTESSAAAVHAVLRYFTLNLPAPVVGELHSVLKSQSGNNNGDFNEHY